MNIDQVVINTICFRDLLQIGTPQTQLFQDVRKLGLTRVEVRREYIKRFPEELIEMRSLADEFGIELYYSIPEWLFEGGNLREEQLKQYLTEAAALGAQMVKFSVGEFTGFNNDKETALKNIINGFPGVVTVENDQTTESGSLEVNLNFLRACREYGINMYCTYDVGNWYWVNQKPPMNIGLLQKYTRYIHLKNVVLEDMGPRTVDLDKGIIDWRLILKCFPEDVPVGIEYPCGPRPEEVLARDIELLLAL